MTDLRTLLEALRQGARPPLSVEDVEHLLGWLSGSAAREGELGDALPRPGHDPVLLQMVLYRLDDVLFDAGELKPAAAGVDASEPATRRRIRFRRLASAFHPDRFPDLADWLTQRSQAVHRAYAHFKQDPDAPPVVSVPPASQAARPRQDVRRAATRVPKQRFRAFADKLRRRFGNDRFLAPKLIGGVALLALLPVLNMVLVPSPNSEGVVGSAVSLLDSGNTGETEEPGSGFRVPGSGKSEGAGTAESGQESEGAGSGREESVQDGETVDALRFTVYADDDAGAADAGSGSVGAVSGREEQRPEARLATAETGTTRPDVPARKPDTGNRKPAPSTTSNQQPTTPSNSQNPAFATPSQPVTAGPAYGPDEPGPDSRIAGLISVATYPDAPAVKPKTGNPNPSEAAPDISPLLAAARRAMNPNGEIAPVSALQTVDEQLAAMGLETDTARLYRRIGTGEEEAEKPVSGFRVPGSGKGDAAGVEESGQKSVGADSDREEQRPEARLATAETGSTRLDVPARKPETGNPKPAPSATNNQQPTTPLNPPKPETGSRKPSPSEPANQQQTTSQPANQPTSQPGAGASSSRDDSELTLGLLASHPAGEALTRLHTALAAGDIAGVAGSFAPDARMGSLRGRDEIAEYFRAELHPADSRRVKLKVNRLGRDDDGWRVEADLDVRVDRDGTSRALLSDRRNFWLAERGKRMVITRVEPK